MAATVTLHPWSRRDRSELERWPASTDPLAWLWAYSPRLPQSDRVVWGVEVAGELVGRVTLRGLSCDTSLGIYLRPDRLGQGIGRAALALVLDLAFGSYALHSVRLDVALANMRAVRCYMAVGFTVEEGKWWTIPDHPSLHTLRPNYVYLGPPHHAVYWHMQITALEWQEQKDRYASAYALSVGAAAGAGV